MGITRPYTAFTFVHAGSSKSEIDDQGLCVLTIARDAAEAAALARQCLPLSELALLSYGPEDLMMAELLELKGGEARIVQKKK